MVEHNQSQYYGNQYKFNGKELDSTTGMYYYGARYYEPRFSIFVSLDPAVEMTMEPYSYTGNNPIMFTDPTGMSKEGTDDLDNRYRIYRKNNGDVTRIEHVNNDGGDEIDYITEINVDQPMMYASSSKSYSTQVSKYESKVKTNNSSKNGELF